VNGAREAITPEPVEASARPGLLAAAARPAELLLGAVFIVSALLKAFDVNSFVVAIGLYGVVPGIPLQTTAALATLALETALGLALLLGMRPRRLTLGGAALLLVAFSGLVVYGWLVHDIKDCGCTGAIKMGPVPSLLKNAVLLGLCAVAAWGFRARTHGVSRALPKVAAAALAAVLVTGYAYAHLEPALAPTAPATPSTAEARPFAQFVFEANGRTYDLGAGEYLVAMLNMECEHCMESVEYLNRLAKLSDMPTVVGLCDGNEESLHDFSVITSPEFPLHPISVGVFYTLIDRQPPRFIYVRDGQPVHHWDEQVPKPDEILKVRQEGASPGA
jgi:uncharacterized membrane protein